MITYHYTAKDIKTSEIVKGEVQADSESAAVKLLTGRNLFPIEVGDVDKGTGVFDRITKRVSTKDRIIFTRQLSTLINAGLPLLASIRTVKDQISNQTLRKVIDEVINAVEGGSSLSNAFAQHPKIFNQIYVSLVAAGESSGTLDKTLERLANQQEKDAAIVSKIRGAMIYPIIVLVVIGVVLIFMLATVLPQVDKLYHDLHKTLPIMTRLLVAVSSGLLKFWWLFIVVLGLVVYGLFNYFKTDKGQVLVDNAKLHLPLIGRLFKKVYMARYARTLATLLASGIPMLQGLEVVRNALANRLLADSVDRQMKDVRGGKALSTAIEGDENFTLLVPQMIKIGEQSGAIDDMLNRVATFYENEVDEEVKNISTVIEPVLMVVLGLMVGFIIASVLLPIYSLVGGGIS